MSTYKATAEHCSGQSVGHPCTTGCYEDPVNFWETEVQAENEDAARDIAMVELESLVDNWPVCDCRRKLQPGSNRWWESVCVSVSLVGELQEVDDA